MQTLKVKSTTYTLASLERTLAVQALAGKITGKHKPVKSRGAEKRLFPAYGETMSPAEYVSQYYTLNSNRRSFKSGAAPYGDANLAGFYEGLSDRVSVPVGVDSMEVEA
jgi:hypothetical protein